ncbi:MAG: DUF4982 domain-containing protein [Clostridia bacterium]|nr:DUF4982 domain-containing protein [Clostridia bacterium]
MGIQTRLDADWRFHLGDAADAGFMGYDDRGWRTVTLPHDWAVEHPFDTCHASGTGYLPGGTAWYRKHFVLPEDAKGKRVRLTFQGVYKHAKVWINSNYLGFHAYGYTSFSYDISPFVRPGENVAAVRVEHSDVADSRWYTGSGITRHVLLEVSEPASFRENGVFVSVLRAENGGAAQLRVRYDTFGAEQAQFRLLDRDGVCAAAASAAGEKGELNLLVPFPQYWRPEDPYLYTLQCEAVCGNRVTDTVTVPVGIRTFRFDPDAGFFLNGEPMKIKGVCVHHDAGCLGAAVPKTVWARRLRKFKEAGCNAIRTAHNPPDPDLLDLCDTLGFLVMDEAFDEWEGTKNKWWQGHNVYPPRHFGYAEDFPQWHGADLSSMVLRDRNHPCVILWSIGNEIDYPNDPYVTPLFKEALGNNDANKPAAERLYDPRKPDAGRLKEVAEELTAIVHRLDDTRPVTSALSFPELSNRTGFADQLDVVGYNYREHFYEDDHRAYPGRVILGSENSHDPKAWFAVRNNPFMSAQFLWTGIDFLGECRGWPVRISQAGMLDLAGFEKPLFFQRKALWTEEAFVRIAVGDGDSERHGVWNEHFCWTGEPGQKKTVSCYTGAREAELFLNGRSLGKKQIQDADGCRVCWEVEYQPGTLRAVVDGAEDALSSLRPAFSLLLSADTNLLPADGLSVLQVEILLTDENGQPARDEAVLCQPVGDITLLGIENGRPDDLTPYAENRRATLDGRAIAYLRAGTAPGKAVLNARTASGLQAECAITLAPARKSD